MITLLKWVLQTVKKLIKKLVKNTQRLNESNFTDWNIERVLNSIRCLFGSHSSNGCFGSVFHYLIHTHCDSSNFYLFRFIRVFMCAWIGWPCVIFFRILFLCFYKLLWVVFLLLLLFIVSLLTLFGQLTFNTFTWFFIVSDHNSFFFFFL